MAPRTSLAKLDFKEPLLPQGKRETSDALLKRLKTLRQKLAELEQDMTDTKSLDPIRKPLIQQTLLHHKDRGVKAYIACCLADLLRLYAPDAPYSDVQLRDIFQFFLTQLQVNLRPSTSAPQTRPQAKSKATDASQSTLTQRITDIPYYTDYYYLIESLATIKSIVLICDVPGSEDLMDGYFNGFMEIVRPDMNKTLMRYMRDVLVAIIEEASSLPTGVMDCIIGQFEMYASKPETPSFQLTVDVCNEVADKLKRPFYAHFSEIQLAHGRDPSPNDLKILSQSHDLLLTINRFCPDTLLNTVPLLEENLKAADEIPLRQLSTRTLGHLFAQRAGSDDPAKRYPSTWRAWLLKKTDKAVQVRLSWVETTQQILVAHPEVRRELEDAMAGRFEDPDEKVRVAICKVIGSLDYETALHHVRAKTLQVAGGRMLDKKSAVRAEAASALAKLYGLAYPEIEANNSEVVDQFAWIPQAMIAALFRGEATNEMRVQISTIFKTSIIPLPQDAEEEQAWVDRLLLISLHLDEDGMMGLKRMTNLIGYAQGNWPFSAFAGLLESYGGGENEQSEQIKGPLNFCINMIARTVYGEPEKAKKDLLSFADINEPRLYKLYKTCVDIASGLSAIVKARNEFLRRVHQSHEDLLPTLTTLIDMSAWNVLNHSSIPSLIRRLQRADSERIASAAAQFLGLMAKEGPPMYKSHVQELVAAVADKKNGRLVEIGFQGLAAVCKVYPEIAPSDNRTIERAINVAQEGTPRQAKFATRFLARSRDAASHCSKLIDAILKAVSKEVDGERQLTLLTVLSELARSAPKAFERKSTEIIKYVMNEVLLETSPSQGVNGDEWVPLETLEPLDHAKTIALRVCTHWSLAFARDEDASALIRPTLTLLTAVLSNDGMINENTREGGPARCHMRLRASLCLLKLAHVKTFDKIVSQPTTFDLVGGTVQDPCYMVRHLWLKKLQTALLPQRLLPRWNLMPALAAMDPDQDNVALAKKILSAIPASCARLSSAERIERIEMPFARLLHLLTHHPDFEWHEPGENEEDEKSKEGITSMQNLKDIARFIELYLDCLAHRDNVGLLFAIAGHLKAVRDRFSDNNKPLYSLSELAQIIIRNRAAKHGWSVPVYPGKISMPRDIFHNAETPEERTKVLRTQYLSEEVRGWARGLGKRAVAVPSIRRVTENDSSPRKRIKSSTKTPRKKRRQSETSDEDSDASSSESEVESEIEVEDEPEQNGEEEAVLGRGGKRGAKTKANRAVGKKARREKAEKKKRDEKMDVDEGESEASE
ncbi:sister chromatid cohesion protein PDS5 [Cryptococcus neoformans Bt63]|nr:sister chromatid cohesion protein PDS5 [Cryptococcus neoformans var. grubii Bt63]